jgi:hypothetical protein
MRVTRPAGDGTAQEWPPGIVAAGLLALAFSPVARHGGVKAAQPRDPDPSGVIDDPD